MSDGMRVGRIELGPDRQDVGWLSYRKRISSIERRLTIIEKELKDAKSKMCSMWGNCPKDQPRTNPYTKPTDGKM